MNKRLLFLISGLGLGNSTRCDALIQELLAKGYHIDIFTSANGHHYFLSRNTVPPDQLYSAQTLFYGKNKQGHLSLTSTVGSLIPLGKILLENTRSLKNIIQQTHYRAIVMDSDYTVCWIKKSAQMPIIAINNSDIVVAECKRRTLPHSILAQYMIEKLDYRFHRHIPDLVISPSIEAQPDHGKFRHFPPIVRQSFMQSCTPPEEVNRILVMLSGSQFSLNLDFLRRFALRPNIQIDVVGRDGETHSQIRFHGRQYNNENLVRSADVMVINGGFSAVSEAVVLQKPAVVIPIPNHAEQYINAELVQKNGLGVATDEASAHTAIEHIITNFRKFQSAVQKFACPTNGTQRVAEAIHTFLN